MSEIPVSVIMPAFNAQDYLLESLQSLSAQTFREFEIVVVDDGSTDATASLLSNYSDSRLRVITLPENSGLATARNAGLSAAAGKYVAWLDADDFSYRKRLSRQIAFMERHPAVAVCGSWVRLIGGPKPKIWRYPQTSEYLRARLLFDNPFATSSVMVRREALRSLDLTFDSSLPPAEDYDLWERISHRWEIRNMPRVLTAYRIHAEQTTTKSPQQLRESIARIQLRQLWNLRLDVSDAEWRLQAACGVGWGEGLTELDMNPLRTWLNRIEEANDRLRIYNSSSLRLVLSHRYRFVRNRLRQNLLRTGALRLETLMR